MGISLKISELCDQTFISVHRPTSTASLTFTKAERLKSRKTIGRLFKEGHSFVAWPLRVVWVEAPPAPPGGGESVVSTSLQGSLAGLHTAEESVVSDSSRQKAGSGVFSPPPGGAQLAVSVPKRIFKTAVMRNRLKRRIREAYRLHKHEFYEKLATRNVALMLTYIAKEELPFADIEAGIKKMIAKFP